MQTTLDLLDRATKLKTIPEWTESLGLSRKAIYTAKDRGHLSPVIAGLMAIELHEDADRWMRQAVIEGEKDSPAKRALMKQLEAQKKVGRKPA